MTQRTTFIQRFAPGGTDQLQVGTSEVPLPDTPAALVNIKAAPGNGASVFFGLPGVTIGDGFELAAGEESGWLSVRRLSEYSVIADSPGQAVSIVWMR